jgi:sugar phosphate isomerase/epimerase
MSTIRPLVGAAIKSDALATHLDWIVTHQRDLEIQDPTLAHFFEQDWQPIATQIRTQLRHYTGRLGIHAPFAGIDIACRDRAIQAVVQQRLLQALDFGEAIGATHMVVHSPFVCFGSAHSAIQPKTLEQSITVAQQTMQPVLQRAQTCGCTIVIETILDQHPSHLRAFISAFASPLVRQSIDVGHVRITHARGGASITEWIRQNGDLLHHVHLQDNDGSFDAHWAPGQGDINFSAVFATLATHAPQARLLLELNHADQVIPGWQHLVNLGIAH